MRLPGIAIRDIDIYKSLSMLAKTYSVRHFRHQKRITCGCYVTCICCQIGIRYLVTFTDILINCPVCLCMILLCIFIRKNAVFHGTPEYSVRIYITRLICNAFDC